MTRLILNPLPSACSPESFTKFYGHIYEKSPWVCERLASQIITLDLDTAAGLHDAMRSVVDEATRDEKLKLLNSHPELGSRSAVLGRLEVASLHEQSTLGLTDPKNVHLSRLQANNKMYRDRFGFPFIVAVTGFTVPDILRTFDVRIANTPEKEFQGALEQVHLIALIRLKQMAQSGGVHNE